MSSLKKITSWKKRKVPDDIFHLVEEYIAPYKCFTCQKFLSPDRRVCEDCANPVIQEYENILSFYDLCINIYENTDDEEEAKTLFRYEALKFEENYPITNNEILKKHATSKMKIEKMKDTHKVAVHRFVRRHSTEDERYDDYFSQINYEEYFYHKRIVDALQQVVNNIVYLRSRVEDFKKYYYNPWIERASVKSCYDEHKKLVFIQQ